MPRPLTASAAVGHIKVHNSALFQGIFGDAVPSAVQQGPRNPLSRESNSINIEKPEVGQQRRKNPQKIELEEKREYYNQHTNNKSKVPRYAQPTKSTSLPRARIPHSTGPLPDATKEARRQAMRRKTPAQIRSEKQHRAQLQIKQEAQETETARLIERGKARRRQRDEQRWQKSLKMVRDGQAMMEKKKKTLAVYDHHVSLKRDAMYNQWTDNVFMPIQNKIFEVVNSVDEKKLSRERRRKMEDYIKASASDAGVFLNSQKGQPGHSHQKLVVRKLRDPLKRLIDKRAEENEILENVEKRHEKRRQLLLAGIDPDTHEAMDLKKMSINRSNSLSKQSKPTKDGFSTDKCQRIDVSKWHPRAFEGTPQGYHVRLMRNPVGLQRRSFINDPYKTRASKIIHGDEFGRKGHHVKVESPWQSRKKALDQRRRKEKYVDTQQKLQLREKAPMLRASSQSVRTKRSTHHKKATKRVPERQKSINMRAMPTRISTAH